MMRIPTLMISLIVLLGGGCIKREGSILLSDYRPQSIYQVEQNRPQKAAFPVIDMHSHANVKDKEGLDKWVRIMDSVGVEKTIVLTQAFGEKFDSIFALYSIYPDRFDVWCSFDYTGYDQPGYGPAAVKELERCARLGAKGVGEMGDKGSGLIYSLGGKPTDMHPDDPRLDPLFEKCAELALPVNIHVADPKWMYEAMDSTNDGMMNAIRWRLDDKTGILDHGEMIEVLENTVKRHPGTTFIACHFANCSYDLSIAAALLDKYSNLYCDISARFCYIAAIPRNAAGFFEKYQDRLLYGTDMGTDPGMYRLTYRILETEDEHFYGFEYEFDNYHWPFYGLKLSEKILEKVYRENAMNVYELKESNP
jgi:predicted TIM-barrel fold metal-dependent hydrolase